MEHEILYAPQTATHREERKEMGRIEAFSDGVFAVAVTLLIFNVHTPDLGHTNPWSAITSLTVLQSVLTYIISFLTILVMWVNHHSIFQYVARIDRVFLYLNGGLLLLIVFVNYPTSLLAKYANTTGAGVAAAVYSATLFVMSLFYAGLWRWATTNHRLIANDVDHAELDRISAQYRFGPSLYLLAFCLAFSASWSSIGPWPITGLWLKIGPWLSIGLNAALAVYFAFTGQIIRAHTEHHH